MKIFIIFLILSLSTFTMATKAWLLEMVIVPFLFMIAFRHPLFINSICCLMKYLAREASQFASMASLLFCILFIFIFSVWLSCVVGARKFCLLLPPTWLLMRFLRCLNVRVFSSACQVGKHAFYRERGYMTVNNLHFFFYGSSMVKFFPISS